MHLYNKIAYLNNFLKKIKLKYHKNSNVIIIAFKLFIANKSFYFFY